MEQSCMGQNIILISCFHLGHPIRFYKLRNCNQKWQNVLTQTVVGFFPFKMKFRLILVHTYENFSILSKLQKRSYGRGKYHIISIPLCLIACQFVVLQSAQLVRRAKTKLSILHRCAENGKAWFLFGSLLVSVWKLPARRSHGQEGVGKRDGVQCTCLAPP